MVSRSHEVQPQSSETSALYTLAETLCDTPDGFDRYNYAKCVWLGSPDRQARLSGQHPWPTRIHGGQQYIYSVPVLAAVDAVNQRLLYVGKDNWKPVNDPNAWLVAERHLLRGDEVEHRVLSASVDAAHDLRLALAPAGYDNMPREMRYAIKHRPAYAQTVLSGRLDGQYNAHDARLRYGLDSESAIYEDFEALESMIVAIQQMCIVREQAEFENEYADELAGVLGQQTIHAVRMAA